MKKILLSLSIMLFALGVSAQEQIWNFSWMMGLPMGETKDLTSNFSARGFAVEGRGLVADNLFVGGKVHWQVFYDETNEPFVENTTTISSFQRKYVNTMPLMVTTHYYFLSDGMVRPYAGLGVGTYYIESLYYFGVNGFQEKAWHFGLYPEVGLSLPFGEYADWGLNLSFQYNVAFKTSNARSHNWLGINFGLSYIL